MKTDLTLPLAVLWASLVFGFWITGVNHFLLSSGVVIFGLLAFMVIGKKMLGPEFTDLGPGPRGQFAGEEVLISLHDGRKVRGKTQDGIRYDSARPGILLMDAVVFETGYDEDGAITSDMIQERLFLRPYQIRCIAPDNLDRIPVKR
jgi:hypothetical protein